MKIAGCVVLYNPSNECLDNIKTYIDLVDRLYVLDNSTAHNDELVDCLKQFPNTEYINFDDNTGIANALKVGAERAIQEEFDLLLTMDQDSSMPALSRDALESRFGELKLDDYGIVSLGFNGDEGSDKKLTEVSTWITSGNFIVLENYKKIKGFREELFIDFVDFDLNEQFHAIGKKIAVFQDLSIRHQIGNPKKYNVCGIKFTVMNHAPIRYYYRFRNALYLYRRNKKFYKKLYRKGLFIDIPKVILFEKNKRAKLKMIKRGRRDAKHGKLGKYAE